MIIKVTLEKLWESKWLCIPFSSLGRCKLNGFSSEQNLLQNHILVGREHMMAFLTLLWFIKLHFHCSFWVRTQNCGALWFVSKTHFAALVFIFRIEPCGSGRIQSIISVSDANWFHGLVVNASGRVPSFIFSLTCGKFFPWVTHLPWLPTTSHHLYYHHVVSG